MGELRMDPRASGPENGRSRPGGHRTETMSLVSSAHRQAVLANQLPLGQPKAPTFSVDLQTDYRLNLGYPFDREAGREHGAPGDPSRTAPPRCSAVRMLLEEGRILPVSPGAARLYVGTSSIETAEIAPSSVEAVRDKR